MSVDLGQHFKTDDLLGVQGNQWRKSNAQAGLAVSGQPASLQQVLLDLAEHAWSLAEVNQLRDCSGTDQPC